MAGQAYVWLVSYFDNNIDTYGYHEKVFVNKVKALRFLTSCKARGCSYISLKKYFG